MGEVKTFWECWPWRSAEPALATIEEHSVEPVLPDSPDPFANLTPKQYRHEIHYSYPTADGLCDGVIERDYGSDKSIFFLGKSREFKTGSQFPVWYLPSVPEQHLLFFDAKTAFWQSATHLGIFAAGALMIILIVAFYKPRDRSPRRVMPDKFEIPVNDSNETVSDDSPSEKGAY